MPFPAEDGGTLLYNSFRNTLTKLEPGEWPGYQAADEQALLRQGILIPEDLDETRELRRACRMFRYDEESMVLSVMPTMDCNFRCDYCYEASHCGSGIMQDDTAEKLLAYVRRSAPTLRHLHVAWYGGEPLLGIDRIASLTTGFMAICQENRLVYSAFMVTNGWLLAKPVLQVLQKANVSSIQITLDGDRPYHDARRVLADGGEHLIRSCRICTGYWMKAVSLSVSASMWMCGTKRGWGHFLKG